MANFRPIFTAEEITSTAFPDPILDLSVASVGSDTASLVWTQPNLNGLTFDRYKVQLREVGGVFADAGEPTATPNGAAPFVLTGLTPEVEYEARVKVITQEVEGPFGNIVSFETTPSLDIFDNPYAFFAVANITSVYIVAMEASTIEQNGAVVATLTAGQVYTGAAAQFDTFIGTGKFTAMGLISNDWYTLNPNYTVGKKFAYGPIRNNPQTVSVYAFQDANVTVTVGGNVVATGFISANTGQNFTYSIVDQNCLVEADGLVMASQTSNGSVDQTCLIPAATSLVGFPSNSARVYPTEPMTYWGAFRANGAPFGGGGHENTAQEGDIASTGTQYSGDAVLVKANLPVSALSFADGDGSAAAPFLPLGLMKTDFGVPFAVERVTFASDQPFTVTTNNGGSYTSAGSDAVQFVRILTATDRVAGTTFTTDVPCGCWSEPDIQDQDEYIVFGW